MKSTTTTTDTTKPSPAVQELIRKGDFKAAMESDQTIAREFGGSVLAFKGYCRQSLRGREYTYATPPETQTAGGNDFEARVADGSIQTIHESSRSMAVRFRRPSK